MASSQRRLLGPDLGVRSRVQRADYVCRDQSQSSVRSDLHPGTRVHKDAFGTRCVAVAAYSVPKTDFRKIFGAGQNTGPDSNASEQGNIQAKKLRTHYFGAKSLRPNHKAKGLATTVHKTVCPWMYPGMIVSKLAWGEAPGNARISLPVYRTVLIGALAHNSDPRRPKAFQLLNIVLCSTSYKYFFTSK